MIKSIFLKKINTLNNNDLLKIDFVKDINIIIGPKGGGKSTLFDLLAGLKENYISKNVEDTLKSFSLEFVKAIKFNGEYIMANSLITKKTKEKEGNFISRNDVIFQDDPIKKNINTSSEIEKEKIKYLKKVIESAPEIKKIINNIGQMYSCMKRILQLSNNGEINWTNFFKIKSSISKASLIVNLNYNNIELVNISNEESNYLTKMIENNNDQILQCKKYMAYDFLKVNIDNEFNKVYKLTFEEIIEKYLSLNELLNKRRKKIISIVHISNIFKKAYIKNIDTIKQNDSSEGVKSFVLQAKEYFKTSAQEIVAIKKSFTRFITTNFNVSPTYENKTESFLSYKLNGDIKFTDENLYKILETIFYNPDVKTDVSKWILTTNAKGLKTDDFDDSKLIDAISKLMKHEIIVLANGMNYEHMSLGQKSIYGIKYKFERSIGSDLFLDQPEDNLDNHTIVENILDLIERKANNQIFIVTHNANIGILTNPGKIIVANLNSEDNPYSYGQIISTESRDSESAYYLEGGTSYLEKRFKIIKGGK